MSRDRPRDLDPNVVRDRTLVLRVLVPGLHTSLNDKINAQQEGDASSATPSAAALSADQLLNLDGVTCSASSTGSTLWHFRCDGATYPARLVNLPCPVEVHKTHDHANYHKSADVGQMLIVYEDEYAMEEAEHEKGYRVEGFPSYYLSGLTPPMRKVVQRRYLSRFEERDTKPAPPPKPAVTAVEREVQELIARLSTGKGKPKRTGAAANAAGGKAKEIREVEEEVVDYEPWMGEGGVFTVDDAKMHPECWLSRGELREIDATKKALDEARRVKDRVAAAARDQKAEEEREERKKQEEKAEKKRRKKEKKLKKQQEEEKAERKKQNVAAKTGVEGEIDDLTQVAMAINEGNEGIDDFFDGGEEMFNFEDDDITNLLI